MLCLSFISLCFSCSNSNFIFLYTCYIFVCPSRCTLHMTSCEFCVVCLEREDADALSTHRHSTGKYAITSALNATVYLFVLRNGTHSTSCYSLKSSVTRNLLAICVHIYVRVCFWIKSQPQRASTEAQTSPRAVVLGQLEIYWNFLYTLCVRT